jgi:hypothetical protein
MEIGVGSKGGTGCPVGLGPGKVILTRGGDFSQAGYQQTWDSDSLLAGYALRPRHGRQFAKEIPYGSLARAR